MHFQKSLFGIGGKNWISKLVTVAFISKDKVIQMFFLGKQHLEKIKTECVEENLTEYVEALATDLFTFFFVTNGHVSFPFIKSHQISKQKFSGDSFSAWKESVWRQPGYSFACSVDGGAEGFVVGVFVNEEPWYGFAHQWKSFIQFRNAIASVFINGLYEWCCIWRLLWALFHRNKRSH